MRNVISYFIKYHVAVNIMIIAFIIFGVVGMLRMQSSFFPLLESEIITISVTYPGAAPEEIEEGIVLNGFELKGDCINQLFFQGLFP